jgi:chromosomal replication initiator protein
MEILSPNEFFSDYVAEHYGSEISKNVNELCRPPCALPDAPGVPLVFVFARETKPREKPATSGDDGFFGWTPPSRAREKGSSLGSVLLSNALGFNTDFTFENFVVGKPNDLAFTVSKALSEDDKLGNGMLCLFSDHGQGKSHLSQALGRNALAVNPGLRVLYLTAEDFCNEMTRSLNEKSMGDFKKNFRFNCDILIIEDMTFLCNKYKIQDELSLTLDHLMNGGKKIVLTSTVEPKLIRLSNHLKSRLNSSLIAPIGPPDLETRMEIIRRKAKRIGFSISEKAVELISDRVTKDVRQLESVVVTLSAKCRVSPKKTDYALAKESLTSYDGSAEGGITLEEVRDFICDAFKVEASVLSSRTRIKKVCEARKMAIYVSRMLTKTTLEEIGKTYKRNHSTTLYAYNKMDDEIRRNPETGRLADYLLAAITEKHQRNRGITRGSH